MFVLLITVFLLLLISMLLNKKDISSPSFIFTLSFCFSCIWATIYEKNWSLNLHKNTFFVIAGGITVFIITSQITHIVSRIRIAQKTKINNKLKEINIEKLKKYIFIIIEIFTIAFTIYMILKLTGLGISSLSTAIYKFRYNNVFTENETLKFPKILSLLRIFVLSLGYYFSYISINNYITNKKIDILDIILIIGSIVSYILTGARTGAINMLLACLAIFIILLNKKNSFTNKINLKLIFKIMCIAIIILLLFQKIGASLGRNVDSYNSIDYLALYCGAEIKNLDTFLQEQNMNNSRIWNSQSFIYMVQWIGPKLGIENTKYQLYLPFRRINGYGLGNVYTTFYPYIYDFGYKGMIILVMLMSLISQFFYEKAKKSYKKLYPNIYLLIYSYIFGSLVLSFFSNKFYEQNFNKQFVYMIIIWNFLNLFCCKIKIKIK